MFTHQSYPPLQRPLQARMRSVRRPFHPSQAPGPYRLPNEARDRLTAALGPFRNRAAAFALATFLARFWSAPGRFGLSFPVDRCALANRRDLGLTEGQIRGALRTLEGIGFLDRAVPPPGSRYKATEEGLRRKAILFNFGPDYGLAFTAANRRARAAQERRSQGRRVIASSNTQRPYRTALEAQPPKLPESKSEAERAVLIGKVTNRSGRPPSAFEPNPKLEAALDRLLKGIRDSRGG